MGSPQQENYLCDTDSPSSISPDKVSLTSKNDGWTLLLVLAAVSTTLGSAIPFGYNIGVINTPALVIQQWCNVSLAASGVTVSVAQLDLLWSCVVSMFLVGGMIGSFAASWCADRIGRKGALVMSDVFGLLSAVMFFTCKPLSSISLLFIARFIVGLSSGLTLSVMPMYLIELAPESLRGAVAVLTTFGVTFGVLFGQFMSLDWLLGNAELWHYLLSLYLLLIAVSALVLPFLPESPKYLYSVRGAKTVALQELSRLRGCPAADVAWELEVGGRGELQQWSVMKVLCTPSLRLPLALVCALQAGQQFSGINAVFFYSTSIFRSAGLSQTGSQYANLGAGVVNFSIAAVMIPVVNCCRRRTLLHVSCGLATLTLVLLAVSISYMETIRWMANFSIFCVLFYVLVYGFGLGPIPYFIGSELFDVGPRPAAMALGSAANWTGNLIVGMSFPTLQRILGPLSFLLFAGITAALTIFLHFKLPETFSRHQNIRASRGEQTPLAKQVSTA